VVVDRNPQQVVDVVLDLLADVDLEPLDRVQTLQRGNLLEDQVDLVVGLLQQAEEQVFLGVDVVVKAPLEDAQLIGDVQNRGVRIAALVEDARRGVQDLAIALLGPLRRCAGGLGRSRHDRRSLDEPTAVSHASVSTNRLAGKQMPFGDDRTALVADSQARV
jgi:hypothetical protein